MVARICPPPALPQAGQTKPAGNCTRTCRASDWPPDRRRRTRRSVWKTLWLRSNTGQNGGSLAVISAGQDAEGHDVHIMFDHDPRPTSPQWSRTLRDKPSSQRAGRRRQAAIIGEKFGKFPRSEHRIHGSIGEVVNIAVGSRCKYIRAGVHSVAVVVVSQDVVIGKLLEPLVAVGRRLAVATAESLA